MEFEVQIPARAYWTTQDNQKNNNEIIAPYNDGYYTLIVSFDDPTPQVGFLNWNLEQILSYSPTLENGFFLTKLEISESWVGE